MPNKRVEDTMTEVEKLWQEFRKRFVLRCPEEEILKDIPPLNVKKFLANYITANYIPKSKVDDMVREAEIDTLMTIDPDNISKLWVHNRIAELRGQDKGGGK